jgi:para-nitrobenzyl esterase
MLLGSVSEEGNQMHNRPTEEEWHANLAKAYGEDKAAVLVAALKRAHPEKSIRTLSYMCSGTFGLNSLSMRNNIVKMAKLKHEQNPELQFCFDNTKRCEQGTGNTPEAQALAKKMASAWANFARTGNPSQPGLTWTPTDPDSNRTMVWDNEPRMVDDPEGEVRKILLS